MATKQGRVEAGNVSDFPENSMHPIKVDGREVLLVHQGGKFYAMDDVCTHDGGILHDGELLEGKVKCERHGAMFSLETGRPTMPAVKKVRLYQTQVEGDTVFIDYQEA